MHIEPEDVRTRNKFLYWSQSAPLMLPVLLAVVAASFYFHVPEWPFLAANAGAGVASFFAWHLTANQPENQAVLLGVVAVCLGLFFVALWFAPEVPLPLLFSQGVGTVGATQSLCFVIARYAKQA